jgi:hypothetical protein
MFRSTTQAAGNPASKYYEFRLPSISILALLFPFHIENVLTYLPNPGRRQGLGRLLTLSPVSLPVPHPSVPSSPIIKDTRWSLSTPT